MCIFITSYLNMLAAAHVHIYGQNRLHVNLRDLSKISGGELAKCVQKVTEEQDLPPDLSINDSGAAWGRFWYFLPRRFLMENKTSMVPGAGPSTGP